MSGNWPVNIEIRGRRTDDSRVDWLPSGVYRNGQLWVSLRQWLDVAAKKRAIKQFYDAPSRTLTVQSAGKTVNFRVGSGGVFSSIGFGDRPALFVPAASLEKSFAAKFQVDAKAHQLRIWN